METGNNVKKNTFRKEVKATEWAFDRIKEAFGKVSQDEARKMSIVQEIMIGSTDYLRRIIVPVGGRGGVTPVPALQQLPLGRLHLVGLREKSTQLGGVRYVERNTIGSNRTGFWSYKQVTVLRRPRYTKHMQYIRAFAQI